MIGFAAAGPLLARFYGNPLVSGIAVGLSVTIFLSSMAVLHQALLMRAMHFPQVSANEVVARIVSACVSIACALAGWRYWALVAGLVAQSLSQCIGVWGLCRWIPRAPRRTTGVRQVVTFAMNVYARFSFNYASRNLDNVLIGWNFNAQSLGFYKKAYDLFAVTQVVQNLTSVGVSALSRLQRDSQAYRRSLLNALAVAAFCGMACGAILTLVGSDVIRLLLGAKWEPAGRIFRFFGPGIGAMFLYGTHGWIHPSIGRADRWCRWGVVEFCVTGLLFVLALPWGPAGIATASSVSLWILTMPALWYAGRPIELGALQILAVVWRYVLASLAAAFVSVAIAGGAASGGEGWQAAAAHMAVTLPVFGLAYVGAVVLLHRSSVPIVQFVRLLQLMVPWGPVAPTGGRTGGAGQSRPRLVA
jgi:PST family polysaccharide transporter